MNKEASSDIERTRWLTLNMTQVCIKFYVIQFPIIWSLYTALTLQKEVTTIFKFLRYGTKSYKTQFCLIYQIFNKMFRLFDDWVCQLKVSGIITTLEFEQ